MVSESMALRLILWPLLNFQQVSVPALLVGTASHFTELDQNRHQLDTGNTQRQQRTERQFRDAKRLLFWEDQNSLPLFRSGSNWIMEMRTFCAHHGGTTNSMKRRAGPPAALTLKVLALRPDQITGGTIPMDYLILLADDNEKLRRSVADILEEAGYSVVQAATGKEALAHLNSSTEFDLLITDLVMPDMEDLELITVLKKSHPELTIVAISGSFDGQFLHVAKLLGVKETLEKPLKRATLLKTVESALSKKANPVLP